MKGIRAEVPVLLTVWVLCVTTDWSTGTKIALNVAAVAGLCLHEYLTHRRLQRDKQRSVESGRAAAATGRARHRSFAAA
ncbi:hypothetical protein ACFFON_04505 [Arthrobacter citreus]|uniref:hypothetical protein n=1 Tax=Arthrobacter TaxID=1663 RepID=UPI0012646C6B|nr:hypothetical protein [Arthrobacter gandavensis]